MREVILAPLRAVRLALAGLIAASVERWSALEPLFTRAGRTLARRSRLGGSVYWLAQEALMARLRQSGHRFREVTIRNTAVYVDVTDSCGRYPFFYARPYEQSVTDALLTALKPSDVFIDVGANIGYFSSIAAKRVGNHGRVIAFEPHDGAREALRGSIERNAVSHIVEIVPLALAEREADFTFYTTDHHSAYSTLDPERSPMRNVAAFHPSTVVHATTLDDWLGARPELSGRVRCIKIDVEGVESRVVAGMTRTLQGTGLTIVCETTIGSEADVILERAGFRRHRIERGTSPYGNFLYVRPGPAG
uniref:Putative methyltransferase n=1 Tax=uncultured bacterium 259 TaxID=698386 RepID=E3T6Q4_9BACT|nr:putative methyltransferase [uncultured bacterium 259]